MKDLVISTAFNPIGGLYTESLRFCIKSSFSQLWYVSDVATPTDRSYQLSQLKQRFYPHVFCCHVMQNEQ